MYFSLKVINKKTKQIIFYRNVMFKLILYKKKLKLCMKKIRSQSVFVISFKQEYHTIPSGSTLVTRKEA